MGGVRVQVGNNIYRILGFLDGAELIVLNHAFQKKTQKTPIKEIRAVDKGFEEGFEDGYKGFKIGAVLKRAREESGLT